MGVATHSEASAQLELGVDTAGHESQVLKRIFMEQSLQPQGSRHPVSSLPWGATDTCCDKPGRPLPQGLSSG